MKKSAVLFIMIISMSIIIRKNFRLSLKQKLKRTRSHRKYYSEPTGADVFLDGKLKGTTPFTTEGPGEGSYAVEIQMEDYTTVSRTTMKKLLLKLEYRKIMVNLLPDSFKFKRSCVLI